MNVLPNIGFSACPHDCPSTCALDVELLPDGKIGRIHGAKENGYTAGVICEKVARYAERLHNPDRLSTPLRRAGPKGSGEYQPISWDHALDEVAEAFLKAEQTYGSEAVWPYYYAGTMGYLMRYGINRLTHAKKYSRFHGTICATIAKAGFEAGAGTSRGPDPREMAKSDLVVIWGTNPVNTQVNVMTHANRARKNHGAKIAVVDVYRNASMKNADIGICLRPGSDGAFACAVMHILFRDGHANWDYMEKYADHPRDLEKHLKDKTPEWASAITGLDVSEIEQFAQLVGTTPKTYLRLGYGFTRSRNGAVNMHAASSIATVTGAWAHEGGGAFHTNGSIFGMNRTVIEGKDVIDTETRVIDQCRIGKALLGEKSELGDGPPITAMLIQNTNPMVVAPDQNDVAAGFAREDLFVCVHEQIMTETAKMADIVLPATMFLEHDDMYQAGGQQSFLAGPKLLEPHGECRSNHDVLVALAKRVGADHPGFDMTALELLDAALAEGGHGTYENLKASRWIDCQPDFETSHFISGFATEDGKFHFKPDWSKFTVEGLGQLGPAGAIPEMPDYWDVVDQTDETHPFRLATSPAKGFLNSSFNETPGSLKREGRPELRIHPDDAARRGIEEGGVVEIGNQRGAVKLHARVFPGVQTGVVICEGLFPNHAFIDGQGINVLSSSDQVAPIGGSAFHDIRVWIKPVNAADE